MLLPLAVGSVAAQPAEQKRVLADRTSRAVV